MPDRKSKKIQRKKNTPKKQKKNTPRRKNTPKKQRKRNTPRRQKKTQRKKKQIHHGGKAGTSGSMGTLADNIFGVIENVVKTIVGSVELVIDVAELPGSMDAPYREKAAPGIELI